MNQLQILEQMLSFSLQQHGFKDKIVEDLQKQNTEYQKQLNQASPSLPPSV